MKANDIRVNNPLYYNRVHEWIKKQRGLADRCEIDSSHTSNLFEWANISRKYLIDIKDWIMLCKQCHATFDRYNLTVEELTGRYERYNKFIKSGVKIILSDKKKESVSKEQLTFKRQYFLEKYFPEDYPKKEEHVHIRGITHAEYFA